jgi:hypothetical protein
MLSILCHFHGLRWQRISQKYSHREGPFWEQNICVRDADFSPNPPLEISEDEAFFITDLSQKNPQADSG